MTHAETFVSIDAAQRWMLEAILVDGKLARPRQLLTRELIGVAFSITNPRRRCVAAPARRFSLPLAIGEFAWHMRRSDEVAALSYYAKRWSDFAEDGKRITASCYGRKMFARENDSPSQWERVVDILRSDPESRRAVVSLWDGGVATASQVDVSCTCDLQFLLRDGRLHALVFMRSNDSIWGVPYDVFLFTMLQEYLAKTLGADVGTYTHFVGSLHLYERHFQLAERILRGPEVSFEMPPMDDLDGLNEFLAAEAAIRAGHLESALAEALPQYWRELSDVLVWFHASRTGGAVNAGTSRYSEFLTQRVREATTAA